MPFSLNNRTSLNYRSHFCCLSCSCTDDRFGQAHFCAIYSLRVAASDTRPMHCSCDMWSEYETGSPLYHPILSPLTPGSAAEEAGLLPGDRIVSINREDVTLKPHTDLIAAIKASGTRGSMSMGLVRTIGGGEMERGRERKVGGGREAGRRAENGKDDHA